CFPRSFSLFSCVYSPVHPHLPSFPTRRSSDLKLLALDSPAQLKRSVPGGYLIELHVRGDIAEPFIPSLRSLPGVVEVKSDHDQVDRKSTRLNSSHGSISYAVFCLKKKKTTMIH